MGVKEREIEAYFVKRVREAGGLQYKFVSPGHRNVPDRIVLFKGTVYFVELKALGKALRPDQVRERARIEEHGGNFWVLRSIEDVDIFISYMLTRR
jgi:hypothetical protein